MFIQQITDVNSEWPGFELVLDELVDSIKPVAIIVDFGSVTDEEVPADTIKLVVVECVLVDTVKLIVVSFEYPDVKLVWFKLVDSVKRIVRFGVS